MASVLRTAKGLYSSTDAEGVRFSTHEQSAYPLQLDRAFTRQDFQEAHGQELSLLFTEEDHLPLSLQVTDTEFLSTDQRPAPPPTIRRQWDIDSIYFEALSLGAFEQYAGVDLYSLPRFGTEMSQNSYTYLGDNHDIQPHLHKNLCIGSVQGYPRNTLHMVFPYYEHNAPLPALSRRTAHQAEDDDDAALDRAFLSAQPPYPGEVDLDDRGTGSADPVQLSKGKGSKITNALTDVMKKVFYEQCWLPALSAIVPNRNAPQTSHTYSNMQARQAKRSRTADTASGNRAQVKEAVAGEFLAQVWGELTDNCNLFPRHFGRPILVFQCHGLKQTMFGNTVAEVLQKVHQEYFSKLNAEYLYADRFWVDLGMVDSPTDESPSPKYPTTFLYKRQCLDVLSQRLKYAPRRPSRSPSIHPDDQDDDDILPSLDTRKERVAYDPEHPMASFTSRQFVQFGLHDAGSLEMTLPSRKSYNGNHWPVRQLKAYNNFKHTFRHPARSAGVPFNGPENYELMALTASQRLEWMNTNMHTRNLQRLPPTLTYEGLDKVFRSDAKTAFQALGADDKDYASYGVRRELSIQYSVLAKLDVDELCPASTQTRDLHVCTAADDEHRPFFAVPTKDLTTLLLVNISRFYLAAQILVAHCYASDGTLESRPVAEGVAPFWDDEQRIQGTYALHAFHTILRILTYGGRPEVEHRWLWLDELSLRDKRRNPGPDDEDDQIWKGLGLGSSCQRKGIFFLNPEQWIIQPGEPVRLHPETGIRDVLYVHKIKSLRAFAYNPGASQTRFLDRLDHMTIDGKVNYEINDLYKQAASHLGSLLNDPGVLTPGELLRHKAAIPLLEAFTLDLQGLVVQYNVSLLQMIRQRLSHVRAARKEASAPLNSKQEAYALMEAVDCNPTSYSPTRVLSIFDIDAIWAAIYTSWDQTRYLGELPNPSDRPIMPTFAQARIQHKNPEQRNATWSQYVAGMLMGSPVGKDPAKEPPGWRTKGFVRRFEQANQRWHNAVDRFHLPVFARDLFKVFVQAYAGSYILITPNFDAHGPSAKFLQTQSTHKPARGASLYTPFMRTRFCVPAFSEQNLYADIEPMRTKKATLAERMYGPEKKAGMLVRAHQIAIRLKALNIAMNRQPFLDFVANHHKATDPRRLVELSYNRLRPAIIATQSLAEGPTPDLIADILHIFSDTDHLPPAHRPSGANLALHHLMRAKPQAWIQPQPSLSIARTTAVFNSCITWTVTDTRYEVKRRGTSGIEFTPALAMYSTVSNVAAPCLAAFVDDATMYYAADDDDHTPTVAEEVAGFIGFQNSVQRHHYTDQTTGLAFGFSSSLDVLQEKFQALAQQQLSNSGMEAENHDALTFINNLDNGDDEEE